MTEVVVLGNDTYQVNDREAAWLHSALAEDGPGLPLGGLPHVELEAKGGDTLASALARVQAEIPEVAKTAMAKIPGKEGKQGYSYSYATLADVTRAILPLLGKHGLSWITKPTLLDGRFVLVYKLAHGSGEAEEGVYPLPDRGSPQDIGGAITYARRYALTSVTGVAPDDEDDDAAQATANHGRNTMTTPPMSDYERRLGATLLRVPTPQDRERAGLEIMAASFVQALDFTACLNERGAWRQAIADGTDQTWEELLAERVAAEIAAIESPEQWKPVWGILKERGLDLTWNGQKFSQLLNARALEIQQAQAALVDGLTEAATHAADESQCDYVWGKAVDAKRDGRITEDQLTGISQVLADRLKRLGRKAAGSAPAEATA